MVSESVLRASRLTSKLQRIPEVTIGGEKESHHPNGVGRSEPPRFCEIWGVFHFFMNFLMFVFLNGNFLGLDTGYE